VEKGKVLLKKAKELIPFLPFNQIDILIVDEMGKDTSGTGIVNGWFFGGLMTPYNCEIIDCGAFCEVIFFCISPKNLLVDFFDSLAINLLFLDCQKGLNLIFIYLWGLMISTRNLRL
jgi:hypothetical protein